MSNEAKIDFQPLLDKLTGIQDEIDDARVDVYVLVNKAKEVYPEDSDVWDSLPGRINSHLCDAEVSTALAKRPIGFYDINYNPYI